MRKYETILLKAGVPIPEGYEVHHKDSNHLNNSLDNLVIVTRSTHRRLHAGTYGKPYPNDMVRGSCPKCLKEYLVQYRCAIRHNFLVTCRSCGHTHKNQYSYRIKAE